MKKIQKGRYEFMGDEISGSYGAWRVESPIYTYSYGWMIEEFYFKTLKLAKEFLLSKAHRECKESYENRFIDDSYMRGEGYF